MDIRTIVKSAYSAEGIGALNEIPQPPSALWIRGTLPATDVKKLVVVGSRALTPYGEATCEKLIQGLWDDTISISSGLARGT
ncbi:MAG: DNA-processing protein DprA, partial [bacterium]|nr:DNA-processing protein DprA [bacterium]